MNITFCTEMFPPKSISNALVPQPCEQKKFMETSQEALYRVKRKLESLHNVLRTYAIQNPDSPTETRIQEYDKQMDNICQNVRDTLVMAATETEKWNEKKRNKVSFDTDTGKYSDEMQQTVYISSEQCESDETGKSSNLSVQNYSNVFDTCYPRNMNNFHWSFLKQSDNTIYSLNNQKSDGVMDDGYPSTVKYDKIPERIYYTISSDLFDEQDLTGETTVTKNYALPDMYNESNRIESFNFSSQHTVPIETDEDLILLSPTSSRTEISKDSESDDKSTALLLQEALQFKKALLTRVELEKVCYIDDKRENINSECMSEYSKCSYINNNLQSKFLDIISEEQSLSSSTDKTNRTYMFFNIKQNKQLPHASTFDNNVIDFTHQNEIKDQNLHGGYFDSKQNLCSSSKYFSFNNVSQEGNKLNANKLSLPKHNYLQGNEFIEMVPSTLQIKYLNHTLDKSDKKVMEMNFTNCLKHVEANTNEREICYNYENEGENSETNFLCMNNTNELINCNIDSVELFSHNLNETLYDEENQNSNKNEGCNFLDSESLEQCTNVPSMKDAENDLLNPKLNLSNNEKYIQDNEILMSSPNLSLKRHLGACSLIEKTLVKTSIENTAERHMLIGKADAIYELSLSESKENSIETNLIQDSLTSSINNHSNDSNIPEPLSVTVLINKSTDEEELNLNWSNVKNNFSNDCINEKNTQTMSTNTITLQKYDYVGIENYDKQEPICNEVTISTEKYRETDIRYDRSNTLKDGQNSSVTENSLTDLGNQNSINEADFCRSYSNLISPNSSLYFTDEASSSTAKLNNSYSKHLESNLHLNLDTQTSKKEVHCQDKNSKDTENTDSLPISLSNENKKIVTTTITNTQKSCFKVLDKKQNQKVSDSYNKTNDKTDLNYSKNYKNVSLFNKTEQTSKTENETLNNKASTSYINTNNYTLLPQKNMNAGDKAQSSVLLNKPNTLNVDQNTILSKTSLCQISPRDIKENTTLKRMNTTIKSKNQESYTSKTEKLKKPVTQQNVKDLKSDLNTVRNSMPTHIKVKDLSVESKHNTDCNVNLNKQKSQSQINFRLNESAKHVTSQSYESPRNTNTINNTHSLDTKLKNHAKLLLSTPKTSSRSCIPILKSRLEAARRSENETRPKSPMRGPLTMTMLWRDNLCRKNHNVMEESIKVESKSENNEQYAEEINNCIRKTDDNWNQIEKQNLLKASYSVQNLSPNINSNIDPQEQMVIYVNIYTKYDQNTTKIVDPNKFLEYIRTRELNVEKVTTENQSNKIDIEFSTDSIEKEKSIMHKIVTIVSSVINGNELDQNKLPDLSAPTAKTESLTNALSNAKLKHLCFLSVEQREIDVTAKPSVIDTSTSISDLGKASKTPENKLNKFQICGTPKELNNDEYIALLEILHQEPNIVHLQDLQNVCKKLISEYKKPE
ncbi:uncharacterized protein LOC143154096 [Ptiloglossa arizonensis]|uniref:uncharacterized protein LOC143154096 n=1 Tax=Ptiloglossa arizonensis TaxID=3350558 RepID=UPI003FA05805